ncbi:hypothetical protein H8K90_08570 [Winogradskyella echinorum]|uniref:Uncharacterized protein n=1 Tax=Winogradskyella echinorum TaxID=538189 RepID=A0ABR6Y121_9FLAO|nr:hypothetical protein [Winogradskyella echinorum]MBC3846431.1 hypothetical protein [Winogradskyella echinorum]MBC5750779.1 hypothetical protein [Winogradskyella echinorum]
MKTNNNLGIWMNHSVANLIDLKSKKECRSIVSKFTSETKEEALIRSESLMHNKRQQMNKIRVPTMYKNNCSILGLTKGRC